MIFLLAAIFALLQAVPARAEVAHATAPGANPNDAVRIFALRIPFRAGPIEEPGQLGVEFSEGNAWQPTTALSYPDSYKIYGADGVIRAGTIRVTQKIDQTSEFEIGITMFALVPGTAAIDALVSDDFIEAFHSAVLPHEDPFDRRSSGINQAGLIFRDQAGNVGEIQRGDVFLGTLDLSYVKYIELIRNERVLVTLRLGVFAGIPLNKINSYIGAGSASSVAATYAITPGVSITAAAGGSVQHDRAIKVQSGGVDFSDYPFSFGYQGMLAVNFDGAGGSRVSVGVELQGTSASISDRLVGEPTPTREVDFPNPQADKKLYLARTYRSLTEVSHNATLFVSYRPGGRGLPTFTLYAQEDWIPFPGFPGATNPYIEGGANAQDLGVGLRVRVPIPY